MFEVICTKCGAKSKVITDSKYNYLHTEGDVDLDCGDYVISSVECLKCDNKIVTTR
ncbi:hypothetical protein [Paenibacillus donghaensis]|uniref:hypothetical protein n=1 Tax=Paenibacillus donghaensis TaxID=414771 RepID=UPI0012FDEC80|nr:hypothetical protein [Paenibacillus donghaensis]